MKLHSRLLLHWAVSVVGCYQIGEGLLPGRVGWWSNHQLCCQSSQRVIHSEQHGRWCNDFQRRTRNMAAAADSLAIKVTTALSSSTKLDVENVNR